MNLIIILILLIVFLPLAYAGIIGAPFFLTKKSAVRLMLEEVKDSGVVYDLGAGTGRFIILAKKEFSKNIYGIELAPIIWLIGRLNLIFNSMNPEYLKLGNFYSMDFKNIDAFICFLMPTALEKLKPKFEQEVKKSAKIISYAFEIKGWRPKKIIKEKNIAPIYVYEL